MNELTPYQKDVYSGKICPYCKSKTKTVKENFIYNKKYKGKMMICCVNFPKCNSYVGTHREDNSALGRLANRKLRLLKKEAHEHFDWIWQEDYLERNEVYEELSEHLGLPRDYTHIGFFNEKTCKKVIQWAINKKKELLLTK